jgi:hypothetical protein
MEKGKRKEKGYRKESKLEITFEDSLHDDSCISLTIHSFPLPSWTSICIGGMRDNLEFWRAGLTHPHSKYCQIFTLNMTTRFQVLAETKL